MPQINWQGNNRALRIFRCILQSRILLTAMIFMIILMCMASSAHAENTGAAVPALAWFARWRALITLDALHPAFKKAEVLLNLDTGLDMEKAEPILLMAADNKHLGILIISADHTSLIGLHSDGDLSPFLIGFDDMHSITSTAATTIATKFIHAWVTAPKDTVEQVIPADTSDERGYYTMCAEYLVRDIVIRKFSVNVSHDGFIVAFDDWSLTPHGAGTIPGDIPPSPGIAAAQQACDNFCRQHDVIDPNLVGLHRVLEYAGDMPAPCWCATIFADDTHGRRQTTITYDEKTGKCELSAWKPDPLYWRQGSCAEAPIWAPDGGVWLGATARWRNLPNWLLHQPASLCHWAPAGVRLTVFRPLVDFLPLRTAYTLPSPSPDGQWLACCINNEVPAVVDLQGHCIFCTRDNHRLSRRMSWSADSRSFLLVDQTTQKVYLIELAGKSDIPLDEPETVLMPDNQCAAAEFMPGHADQIIAVVRQQAGANETNRWDLVRLSLVDGKGKIKSVVMSLIACPDRMHVSPDGANVWLLIAGQVQSVNIGTGKATPVPWLQDGAKLIDGMNIDASILDWDISGDMKSLVFTARMTGQPISVALVSSLDGHDVRCLSQAKSNTPLERYVLPGGNANVARDSLPVSLLERLKLIATIPWK